MEGPETVASDRPQRNVKGLDLFSARHNKIVNRVNMNIYSNEIYNKSNIIIYSVCKSFRINGNISSVQMNVGQCSFSCSNHKMNKAQDASQCS